MGLFKSKQDKIFDQEMAYRKARKTLQDYIQKCHHLKDQYWSKAKHAAELDDKGMLRQFATGYVSLSEQIGRAEKFLLYMDGIKLQRDQVHTTGEFLGFAKEMSKGMMSGPDAKDVAKMGNQLGQALLQTEKMDLAFGNVLDTLSDSIVGSPIAGNQGIEQVEKVVRGEAMGPDGQLDAQLESKIQEVERLIQSGQ